MRIFVIIVYFFPFIVSASNVLDILKKQGNSQFVLEKHLKKDIGSVFSDSKKPEEFIKTFEEKNFQKALKIWIQTLHKTSFSKSSTGQALYSYILFKNGYEALALSNLFKKTSPQRINPIVHKLWRVHIDKKHPIWDYFLFSLNPQWASFFDPETVFKIASKASFHLVEDQKYIKSLLALPLDNKTDTFLIDWSFVLSLLQTGDMDSATKILAWILNSSKDQDKKDQTFITIARLLASNGNTKAALYYYEQIKNLSYFWLLAQEEKSWILYKTGDYNKSYSVASNLQYPAFKQYLSPDMFIGLSLAQLKTCDYAGVKKTIFQFKSLFAKHRLKMKMYLTAFKDLEKELLNFYLSGDPYYKLKKSENLFYLIKKDSKLKNSILLNHYLKHKKQYVKIKSLENKKNQMITEIDKKIKNRTKKLLQQEIEKINRGLKNMQIVETEVLYRFYGFHALKPFHRFVSTTKGFNVFRSNDLLVFPYNINEIWLDEISHYQTLNSKQCPKGSYIL